MSQEKENQEISSDSNKKTIKVKDNKSLFADIVRPAVNETIDKAQVAADKVIEKAGREIRRTSGDVERKGSKLVNKMSSELKDVVSDADVRFAKQQEALSETIQNGLNSWKRKNEEIADSIMGKILAVAVTLIILYGSYYYYTLSHLNNIDYFSIGIIFWMGITLCSFITWITWRINKANSHLKSMFYWLLYIFSFSGICIGIIFLLSRIMNFI
jgi:hypothetical protein